MNNTHTQNINSLCISKSQAHNNIDYGTELWISQRSATQVLQSLWGMFLSQPWIEKRETQNKSNLGIICSSASSRNCEILKSACRLMKESLDKTEKKRKKIRNKEKKRNTLNNIFVEVLEQNILILLVYEQGGMECRKPLLFWSISVFVLWYITWSFVCHCYRSSWNTCIISPAVKMLRGNIPAQIRYVFSTQQCSRVHFLFFFFSLGVHGVGDYFQMTIN